MGDNNSRKISPNFLQYVSELMEEARFEAEFHADADKLWNDIRSGKSEEDIALEARIKETYAKLSKMTPEERKELLIKEGIDPDFIANLIKRVEKKSPC